MAFQTKSVIQQPYQAKAFNYITGYLNTELASLLLLLEAIYIYFLLCLFYQWQGDGENVPRVLYFSLVGLCYFNITLSFALLSRYGDIARWIQLIRVVVVHPTLIWLLLTHSIFEDVVWRQKLPIFTIVLTYILGFILLLRSKSPSRMELLVGFTLALMGVAPWRTIILALSFLS